MSASIVLIEDEEDLLELLEFNLSKEGYEVLGFLSTVNVKQHLQEEDVDLLIVDRNLPGVEGSQFVQELRTEGFNEPVIFLTAKVSQEDVEEGFVAGADDYITKPFNMSELLLRIKAVLKRSQKNFEVITFRDIVLKPSSKEVSINNEYIELTRLEFDLLSELIKNKNIVLSREYLLENVWKDEAYFQDKTVNVAINRLKAKIDPSKEKNYIKSVRGTGYTVC